MWLKTQFYVQISVIYQDIEKLHLVTHVMDIHKAWEFSRTSEIKGVFGNLRTFIRRESCFRIKKRMS